ncbi:hypothetical protein Vadar_000375 [Vaccinium darrowii]|uniref:Uncharacterized protein n=1 Tax=Vaccinium darrowii TaxID=229202 RepID=A0ACB7XVM6_9ERIC|nr:hypothetical protein Vadar_000375 [Vaccinium darrowii]
MDDTDVDFFLETLKHLITSSDLYLTIKEKQQLESLEKKIEYLRGFLKVTEKKRNECSEVMKLVKQIRDVVSKAGNIVREFVVDPVKANASYPLHEHQDHLSLDLECVEKEIKTLTDEVMQIYDQNMYDINVVGITKLKHSSTRSGGIGPPTDDQ